MFTGASIRARTHVVSNSSSKARRTECVSRIVVPSCVHACMR